MYWQEKEDPKLIKVKKPIGEYYLNGFADGFHGQPRALPRSKRAREAYARGYDFGRQATKTLRRAIMPDEAEHD
jgi:hypothetical protein